MDLLEALLKAGLQEATAAPVKEPETKPVEPTPTRTPKRSPKSPIAPTPGIHPKPKAAKKDVEMFKRVRERREQ